MLSAVSAAMASSFQLSSSFHMHDVLPQHASPNWARRRQSEGPRSLAPALTPALAPALAPVLGAAGSGGSRVWEREAARALALEEEVEAAEAAEAGEVARAEPGEWRVLEARRRAPFARVEAEVKVEVEMEVEVVKVVVRRYLLEVLTGRLGLGLGFEFKLGLGLG